MAAGGMVSNHRLVLFTHALCRLSYPAVGGKLPDPTAAVCAKLLTLKNRILPPDAMPKPADRHGARIESGRWVPGRDFNGFACRPVQISSHCSCK